jgi:hypothetical protein
VIALGIAASPDSLAFGPTYGAFMVPAFIGAGIGGYRRHRSDRGSSVRTTPNGPGSISDHCLSMRRLPPSHLRLPLPSHRPMRRAGRIGVRSSESPVGGHPSPPVRPPRPSGRWPMGREVRSR